MNEQTEALAAIHQQRHRELVDRLSAELRPVRPLWPVRTRAALWLGLEAAFLIAAGAIIGRRHDLPGQFYSGLYLLQIGTFLVAASFAALRALRSAIPGLEPTRPQLLMLAALLAIAALTLMGSPARADLPLAAFIGEGIGCAKRTLLYGALPWIVLLIAVRRGVVTMAAEGAAALVGAAAFLFSYGVMHVDCPKDERLHLLTWHLLPAVIAFAVSVLVAIRWLRNRARIAERVRQ